MWEEAMRLVPGKKKNGKKLTPVEQARAFAKARDMGAIKRGTAARERYMSQPSEPGIQKFNWGNIGMGY